MPKKTRFILTSLLLALALGALARAAGAAELTNSAGATAALLTTEADSGATLTNSAGAILEGVTTDQNHADTRDSAGAWAFTGLLDPDWSSNAARTWALYE